MSAEVARRQLNKSVQLRPGQRWIHDRACECGKETHALFRGIRADYKDGALTCVYCGRDHEGPGLEGDEHGFVATYANINGQLQSNPFLNPMATPFGEHRRATGDLKEDWLDEGTTDLANSYRLIDLHGDKFRYVPAFKSHVVYDGFRWIPDECAAVERYATDVVVTMMQMAGELNITTDDGKKFAAHALASASKSRIDAMIHLARSNQKITLTPDRLDREDTLINTRQGPVELEFGTVAHHDPEDYLTRLVEAQFNPEAQCPTWDRFLNQLCLDDLELVAWLQKAIGYTITGSTKEQCFFFMFGDGSNGKTTFLETIRRILGDYAATLPFELFLRNTRMNTEHGLAELRGIRMAVASEAPEGRSWNEELLKAVTGGEAIRASQKYQNSFQFSPRVKIWFGANDKPRIHSINEGMWRRIIPIPCRAHIKEEDRDLDLDSKLWDEREGILAWMIRGAELWHMEGLRPVPRVVQETLDEYRTESDTLARFVDECCELDETVSYETNEFLCSVTMLRSKFNDWCKSNSERPLTPTAFGLRLKKFRGGLLQKERDSTGRVVYRGIRLNGLEEAANGEWGY